MTPGVSITFDLLLKPEAAAGFLAAGQNILQGTTTFAGFQHIRIVQHAQDPHRLLFIERWDSIEAYQRYIAWRTETGVMDAFKRIASHTQTDFWPQLIDEAHSAEPIADTAGVSVTMALTLKPDRVQPFIASKGLFDLASSCPGFRSIRMVQHQSDPTRLLFIQRWDSAADYRHYYELQNQRGGIEQIRQIATALQVDIWPALIAHGHA